jgi:hypothetical protein
MTADSTDERLAGLVARLAELTHGGQVGWELAEADRDDSFTYATPAGAVIVFSRDNDGRDPYVLTIRDAHGRLVERVELRWSSADGHLYGLVDRLYRAARRQVLRTDEVIEALLRDLADRQ